MASNGQSFTFNSVDLGDETNYNLWVTDIEFPYLPRPRVNLMPLSDTDGSVSQGSSLESRYFNVRCAIVGTSASDRATKLDNITTVLSATTAGEKTLTFDAFPGKTYNVRLISGIDADVALTGAEFDLEFVAPDPDAV